MNDVKLVIFKLLNIKDSYNYALTCKDNYDIFQLNYLWQYHLQLITNKETIDKLFDINHKLTYKKCHELNIIIKKFNMKETLIEFHNSEYFDIADLNITNIPKEIGYLTYLTKLHTMYLYANKISSIPKEIGKLTNLTELSLELNQLTSIPKEIGNLTNLKYLQLDHNCLTSIPPELGNLITLEQLYLNCNKLTSIPKELGNLSNLDTLDLSMNQLTTIPKELCKLNIGTLPLDNNPYVLEDLPEEIRMKFRSFEGFNY